LIIKLLLICSCWTQLNFATALIWCHPTPTVPANPTPQNMLLKAKFARQPQPANKMSRAKFAYQVLKKENEKQRNLFFGVKFEQMPRILSVENDYAFDVIKR